MGIKGLWGVLTPYSEKKSLHEVGWSYFDNVGKHFPSEVLNFLGLHYRFEEKS